MISCTSPPEQKFPARAREHHGAHVARVHQRAKQIAQLRVGLEGQGILALGSIELDEADAVGHAPLEVHGLISARSCLQAWILLGYARYITSPPATAMLWPVMDSLPGRHSHATAWATSAG
jgi:hypothetical protein